MKAISVTNPILRLTRMNSFSRRTALVTLLVAGSLPPTARSQEVEVEEPAKPQALKTIPVPEPTNLAEFVRDKRAAIALGKALFWDMQVGSDNIQSCASCHFHAGADNRSRNQISPGLLIVDANRDPAADTTFQVGGPNYQLKASDFPFHKVADINNRKSTVLSSINDVTSSQGVIAEQFNGINSTGFIGGLLSTLLGGTTNVHESRTVVPDAIFNVGGANTRRVAPRNSPTVINAVFNLRNFWDGRAQDIFNGVNPFGLRDPDATVLKAVGPNQVEKVKVRINNASLASQAVGPPLSGFEMSAMGRVFPDLGRKLLTARPLAKQKVHRQDSVLGSYSLDPLQGTSILTYADLVRKAFRPEWWQGSTRVKIAHDETRQHMHASNGMKKLTKRLLGYQSKAGATDYNQMEANFSLFFGLAVQLYEATLVSDDSPFDRYAAGQTNALTEQQKLGMDVFFNKGKCVNCHGGAEFTKATVSHIKNERLERMIMGDNNEAVYDNGFYNIGVRPTREDLGVGDRDPFGNPLSESRVARAGAEVFKQLIGTEPNLSVSTTERVAADGAFKTPTLRNVELTGPYFHNGGQMTLAQVVDFYNRGGDFHETNINDLDPDIENLGLSAEEKAALVSFMTSLTDDRVRYKKAPFDHPQLFLPNGHVGTTSSVNNDGQGRAKDVLIELPATGRTGGPAPTNFSELR